MRSNYSGKPYRFGNLYAATPCKSADVIYFKTATAQPETKTQNRFIKRPS